MAKAVPLTPSLMSIQKSTPAADAKVATRATPKGEASVPLQIRIPASEAKAIKRAALDADQTLSEFMLACFHARMGS